MHSSKIVFTSKRENFYDGHKRFQYSFSGLKLSVFLILNLDHIVILILSLGWVKKRLK